MRVTKKWYQMAKSKMDLLAMLKSDLIKLAKSEGVMIKSYWTKAKIADEILARGKTFSAKKEGIAKDFKKRWMELKEESKQRRAPPSRGKRKRPKVVGQKSEQELRKELMSETEKIEAIMAKELMEKVVILEHRKPASPRKNKKE